MRFRHPLVLLLGGLLSASSVGCSAITAVVSDTRPAARQGRGAADRYAAIARVYENQGRYDQAEAMYRKALKQNPNNAEARSSLQQLANRKAGRKFGNEIQTEAIAAANALQGSAEEAAVALNAKTAAVSSQLQATADSELTTASLAVELLANESSSEAGKLSPASFEETATEANSTGTDSAKSAAAEIDEPAVKLQETKAIKAPTVVTNTPSASLVSAEQILAAVDTPGEHAELLLNGLKHGDSLETQCLAATLLGDCDRADLSIRDALQKANEAATDSYLRLAICDSRIQRAEQDAVTAKCLISLLGDAPDRSAGPGLFFDAPLCGR
ncbi:MAG: tetratricopeptide repeat protein [Planctomycetaceae bacterium]